MKIIKVSVKMEINNLQITGKDGNKQRTNFRKNGNKQPANYK
jgi:hypothetical protein